MRDIDQLVRAAEQQGFIREPCKRGNIFRNPVTQQTTLVRSSSQGPRALANTRKELERIGFTDPKRPQKPARRTPPQEEPHMAQQDTAADAAESAAATVADILDDPKVSTLLIAERIRELSTETGQPPKARPGDAPSCKWSGDFKGDVAQYLWPELENATGEQWRKFIEGLAAEMTKERVEVDRRRGQSVWYVPADSERRQPAPPPPALNPFQPPEQSTARRAPAPRPAPRPEPLRPAPPRPEPPKAAQPKPTQPKAAPPQQQAFLPGPAPEPAKGHRCQRCCYVADSASALTTHMNRSVSHEEDDGAPFPCADVLKDLGARHPECVFQAPTVDSLVNHLRRRHGDLVGDLQFCRVPDCLRALPKDKASLMNHIAAEHQGRGGNKNGHQAAPVNGNPGMPRPVPAERTLTPTVPSRSNGPGLPVVSEGMDPTAVVEAIKTMAEQAQRAMNENARLNERLDAVTAERDELKRVAEAGSQDRAEIERLRQENARLKREAEAFEQIKSGLAHLMGGQQ